MSVVWVVSCHQFSHAQWALSCCCNFVWCCVVCCSFVFMCNGYLVTIFIYTLIDVFVWNILLISKCEVIDSYVNWLLGKEIVTLLLCMCMLLLESMLLTDSTWKLYLFLSCTLRTSSPFLLWKVFTDSSVLHFLMAVINTLSVYMLANSHFRCNYVFT